MTPHDPRDPEQDPRDPDRDARDPEQGSYTWERPQDGRPVYGADAHATPGDALSDNNAPSAPPPAVPPPVPSASFAPPTAQAPVLGPALTPAERLQQPVAPPSDSPAPQGWSAAPVEPAWNPQAAPQVAPQAWYPPQPASSREWNQAAPYPQGSYAPSPHPGAPWPAPAPVAAESNLLIASLWIGAIGFLFALCCQPIGFVAGVTSAIMAARERSKLAALGQPTGMATALLWFGIAVVIVSMLFLIINVLVMIFLPGFNQQLLDSLSG